MGGVSRVLLAVNLLWNLSALGQQPKPILPDPKLTPGDVFDVTAQDICVPGYAKKVRAVPAWLKRKVITRGAGWFSPPKDFARKRLAAAASRLADRRKSIVAPLESTARYYTHLPLTRM
jgi:hypothetical protein